MPERRLRVAIVGSGPAGMYAAGHLLSRPGGTLVEGRMVHLTPPQGVEIDVYERLPTPWGLVRGGVAPDHPYKKFVAHLFESVATRPELRLLANVEVGRDVTVEELAQWYDAVIYAVGAAGDQPLGVPGEDLAGCWSARRFVAWYNGHPDHAALPLDLQTERAVVIGNGNVALDVARILTTPVEHLEQTDISPAALEALRASRIREVVVLGRRGHHQAAFHNPELEELAALREVDVVVDAAEPLDPDVPGVGRLDRPLLRKLDTLQRYAARPGADAPKRIVLRFLSSPLELTGEGRVEAVTVVRNALVRDADGRTRAQATDAVEQLPAGLVLRAIGYRGTPLDGLPFDEARGVVPSREGRVVDGDTLRPGTYVTGWIRRGPSGIIGTNKKDARDTVRALLDDLRAGRLPLDGTRTAEEVLRTVRTRKPDLVDHEGWTRIDRHERRAGKAAGRPRVKLTTVPDLLARSRR